MITIKKVVFFAFNMGQVLYEKLLQNLISFITFKALKKHKMITNEELLTFNKDWNDLKNCKCLIKINNPYVFIKDYRSDEATKNLYVQALKHGLNILHNSVKEKRFTFLCCINKLFYKDLRKYLYDCFKKVSANDFLDDLEIINKFLIRNCNLEHDRGADDYA